MVRKHQLELVAEGSIQRRRINHLGLGLYCFNFGGFITCGLVIPVGGNAKQESLVIWQFLHVRHYREIRKRVINLLQ